MNDQMLDLETLGNKTGSIILTVGAIKFDRYGDLAAMVGHYPKTVGEIEAVADCFYRRIEIDSCAELGLKADEDTVKWWMKQKEEARFEAMDAGPRHPIKAVLSEYYMWSGGTYPWSHGAGFDVTQVEFANDLADQDHPWRYSAVRDTRTLYDLLDINDRDYRGKKHHHALFDCYDQIIAAQAAFKQLRAMKDTYAFVHEHQEAFLEFMKERQVA